MTFFNIASKVCRSSVAVRVVLFTLGFAGTGCGSGSDEDPVVTRSDFCDQWAEAACSEEVVSVCQAASVDACRSSQKAACLEALPTNFIDRGVPVCIHAVHRAYEDADLTADELDVVLRFGGPCSDVVIGGETGMMCEKDTDCEPALDCVLKDEAVGTCEDAVTIEPGFSCSEPEEKCEEGFYCNGSNCIAALDEGDDCLNDAQCGSDMYCDEICTQKVALNEECDSDGDCNSGLCYSNGEERTCLDRLRLSPAEPLCADLK